VKRYSSLSAIALTIAALPIHAAPGTLAPVVGARQISGYGNVPLYFEPNQGQWDARIRYLARGSGYWLMLSDREAIVQVRSGKGGWQSKRPQPPVRMRFLNGVAAPVWEGVGRLEGISNYYYGGKSVAGVPHYGGVLARSVYAGVDVAFRSDGRRFEYDFIVAPKADPRQIRLGWEGAGKPRLDAEGNLYLDTDSGAMVHKRPVAYQTIEGRRREVAARFVVSPRGEVSFGVGAYDPNHELVIDPVVIVYSTYFGGSGQEEITSIRVHSDKTVFMTGFTSSPNFPGAGIDPPDTNPAIYDAFAVRFNATGTGILYSTYIGGNGNDYGTGIVVDSGGNAYITGTTGSTNLFMAGDQPGDDAFVIKLNTTGALLLGRYLGGAGQDFSSAIAVDPSGNMYLGGTTTSTGLNTPGTQNYGGGDQDGWVAKLLAADASTVYFTYVGGSIIDAVNGVAVDSDGFAYVTGNTNSNNLVSVTPIRAFAGSQDAFIVKLNQLGTAQVWGTYLGGTLVDGSNGIALDGQRNVYTVGSSGSPDFPQLNNMPGPAGLNDVWVAKINAAGTAFVYATLIGGADNDVGLAIAVDATQCAYIAGFTRSTNFPRFGAQQTAHGGGQDAFLAKLAQGGRALVYSTLLGSTGNEVGLAVAVDSTGAAYLAGTTGSTAFPRVNPFQNTYGGAVSDGFLAKYEPYATPVAAFARSPQGINHMNLGDLTSVGAGGAFSSQPAVAQAPNGDTYVAARSNFNDLWVNRFVAATQSWSGWRSTGVVMAAGSIPSIAISEFGGVVTPYVATRDPFSNYYLTRLNAAGDFVSRTDLQAAGLATDPVTTACPDGNVYVVGRDQFLGSWSRRINPAGVLQPWVFGGGVIPGKPDITCGTDNFVYFAARDQFTNVWVTRIQNETWVNGTSWLNTQASGFDTDPRIVRSGDGRLYLVARDFWSGMWFRRFQEGATGFEAWTYTGFNVENFGTAASSGDLFLVGRVGGSIYWGHLGTASGNATGWGFTRESPGLGTISTSAPEAAPR
jgi:hypothetical protein